MFRRVFFVRVLAVMCEGQHLALDTFQGSWEEDLKSLHSTLLRLSLFSEWKLAAHVWPVAPVMDHMHSAWDVPST